MATAVVGLMSMVVDQCEWVVICRRMWTGVYRGGLWWVGGEDCSGSVW